MKIGLVGEAPNDTQSVQNLLEKEYPHEYFFLLNNINGSNLDNQKTKRLLRIEYQIEKPDLVIFIRDLDALEDDKTQLKLRKEYFTNFNSVVDKKGIFLLHIWEIEALILADIETFNKKYNAKITFEGKPWEVVEPKELLRTAQGYTESDNADIFKELIFENTLTCEYFKLFVKRFETQIKKLSNRET